MEDEVFGLCEKYDYVVVAEHQGDERERYKLGDFNRSVKKTTIDLCTVQRNFRKNT